MAYSRSIWNQLKGLTVEQIAKALRKDNWTQESRAGATIGFIKTSANGPAIRRRIVLHVHPRKTFSRVVGGRSGPTQADPQDLQEEEHLVDAACAQPPWASAASDGSPVC